MRVFSARSHHRTSAMAEPHSAGYPGLADAWLDIQGLQPTGATRVRSRAFLAAAKEAAAPAPRSSACTASSPAPLSRRAVLAATEPSVLTPSQACCDALISATRQHLPAASRQAPATSHQPPTTSHLHLATPSLRPSGRGCPMSGWARAGRATWLACRPHSNRYLLWP